jgi:NADH-quinone oxidoreductase subunit A
MACGGSWSVTSADLGGGGRLRRSPTKGGFYGAFCHLARRKALGYPLHRKKLGLGDETWRRRVGGRATGSRLSGRFWSCLGVGDRPAKESYLMGHTLDHLLVDYLPLVVFIGLSLVIGLGLLVAPFIVAYKNPDPEKLSAYECGFDAFDDARMKFDVRFYLVSILFIIFDLEVAFLFPWAVAFKEVGLFGFWSMMLFLAVLTIGFIYEWKKGALEWD